MSLKKQSSLEWVTLEALFSTASDENKAYLEALTPLLTVHSLTKGLEAIDPNFSVNVIDLSDTNQYSAVIPSNGQSDKPIMNCRKVELLLSEMAVIYAESICAIDAGIWREYLNCGTNSLGRQLFSQEEIIPRSHFTYAWFGGKTLPVHLYQKYPFIDIDIVARKSCFTKNHQSLCITEWFLPSLLNYF